MDTAGIMWTAFAIWFFFAWAPTVVIQLIGGRGAGGEAFLFTPPYNHRQWFAFAVGFGLSGVYVYFHYPWAGCLLLFVAVLAHRRGHKLCARNKKCHKDPDSPGGSQ